MFLHRFYTPDYRLWYASIESGLIRYPAPGYEVNKFTRLNLPSKVTTVIFFY